MRLRCNNKPRLTVNECDHITVAQFGPQVGHSAEYKEGLRIRKPLK